MCSEFPADKYASQRQIWIGYNSISVPTVRKALLGKVENKRVLDIGCGSGLFSKNFLDWSAKSVLGIDNNEKMIEKCRRDYGNIENAEFSCKGIVELKTEKKFDLATGLFIFQFLKSETLLQRAFQNVFDSLDENGFLMAFVINGIKEFNPSPEEGIKLGVTPVKPQEELRDSLPITINYYNGNEVFSSATIYFYFRETYEKLLKEVGFKRIEWMDPIVSKEYLEEFGEEFFKSYMSPPKDVVFLAYK